MQNTLLVIKPNWNVVLGTEIHRGSAPPVILRQNRLAIFCRLGHDVCSHIEKMPFFEDRNDIKIDPGTISRIPGLGHVTDIAPLKHGFELLTFLAKAFYQDMDMRIFNAERNDTDPTVSRTNGYQIEDCRIINR